MKRSRVRQVLAMLLMITMVFQQTSVITLAEGEDAAWGQEQMAEGSEGVSESLEDVNPDADAPVAGEYADEGYSDAGNDAGEGYPDEGYS